MPRHSRIVIPGLPHHITQRGNYQQIVFKKPEDFAKYCYWINRYAAKHKLDIVAYCLMSNHVHFIAIPHQKNSLSLTFKNAHMRYAQYVNKENERKGHLWQGRFFSCILQDTHLYRAVRYVEQNPVRAGIVQKASAYRWSSARWHLGLEPQSTIDLKEFKMVDKNEWSKYLEETDSDINDDIRIKTQKGLAVGGQEFIASLEKTLDVSLRCLGKGRPSKN